MLYQISLKGSDGNYYSSAGGYKARTPQEALKQVGNKITTLDNTVVTCEVYEVYQLDARNVDNDNVVKAWKMIDGKLIRTL